MDVRPSARRKRSCFAWLAVTIVAILAPLWLGPMMLPIERAIAEAQHVCACGMAVGTCGCPACEDLEREVRGGSVSPIPLLKGDCERSSSLSGGAHAAPALLPATFALLPSPATRAARADGCPTPDSVPPGPPPTPPPRRTARV